MYLQSIWNDTFLSCHLFIKPVHFQLVNILKLGTTVYLLYWCNRRIFFLHTYFKLFILFHLRNQTLDNKTHLSLWNIWKTNLTNECQLLLLPVKKLCWSLLQCHIISYRYCHKVSGDFTCVQVRVNAKINFTKLKYLTTLDFSSLSA